MNVEALLTDAIDALTDRRYRRGKGRASLGVGKKQTLLRAVLRAYGRRLDGSSEALLPAPRLKLSRSELVTSRCELSHADLAPQDASDARYEWSLLLRRVQHVDVELESELYRVGLEILHPKNAETFFLIVGIQRDTTRKQDFIAVTTPSMEDVNLQTLLQRAGEPRPDTPPPADPEGPISADLAVVTTLLASFTRTVAERMPDRIRRAAARIRQDRNAKKPAALWSTVVAVLAILVAGMFALRKIAAYGLADTLVDVDRGTITKTYSVEHAGSRVRLIDGKTLHPRSEWADVIVDPITGDRIDTSGRSTAIFRAGSNTTSCTLSCDNDQFLMPRWWTDDKGNAVPGIAIEPLRASITTERRHILYAVLPNMSDTAVRDAVKRGQTFVDFSEGVRLTGMHYVDGPAPMFVGSYHFRDDGLKEIDVQWRSPRGALVAEQYALVCVGGAAGVHPVQTVNVRVPTSLRVARWFQCEQGTIWWKPAATWSAATEAELINAYQRDPSLPHYYARKPTGGVSPAYWTYDFYEKLFNAEGLH
jgi:hypothetical protein